VSRDFTLEKYAELCKALKSNYKTMSVLNYLAADNDGHIAILRHDVDKYPDRSLSMAKVEHSMNIASTYYFRMVPGIFDKKIIGEITSLGHEIGFHYEVLDKAEGNMSKALEIFAKELEEIRTIVDIKTVCMHGSPLKKWRNLDIWNQAKLEDFQLTGEPYLSIDYGIVQYYTDTGRRWDGDKVSIDDHVVQDKEHVVHSTDELISLLEKKIHKQILIQTHPQRWTEGTGAWAKELVGQNVKNVGKRMLKGGSS
jgi:hypothetical protein